MKKISLREIEMLPASHEDKKHPGVYKKILFSDKDFNYPGRIRMINWAFMPSGKYFRRHLHEDMDEVFIILKGSARITVGKESTSLEAGDSVFISKNSSHVMKNTGKITVEYIAVGFSRDQNGKTINL